jgi:hypothetical protein
MQVVKVASKGNQAAQAAILNITNAVRKTSGLSEVWVLFNRR